MWKVVPIQEKQKKDLGPNNLFGDFRISDISINGGGHEKFSAICEKRLKYKYGNNHFIVQLYGCPLKCFYCYITPEGIWADYKEYTTEQLLNSFKESKQAVFHLMGGAPGLYLENWKEIVEKLPSNKVFHSDLLLIEKEYKEEWLTPLKKRNVLIVVNIKGVTTSDFKRNTGFGWNEALVWKNLGTLVKSGINFYITFTNPSLFAIDQFKSTLIRKFGDKILNDSYNIDPIKYKAVDAKFKRDIDGSITECR